MKAAINIVKTINGSAHGTIIATCNDIEQARQMLADELQAAATDDYNYFATTDEAEAEITFADEARESWGDARTDRYIAALREGIESGTPFIADSVNGDCVTTEQDVVIFDNFRIEIVTDPKINTLQDLADYINSCDDYDNEIVEAACALNGWEEGDDEWHIANDGENQVIFNDAAEAIVTLI